MECSRGNHRAVIIDHPAAESAAGFRGRPLSERTVWKVTREAFWKWYGDNASRLSAALTFYMIFSLAPTVIIVVAVAAVVVGETAARGELLGYLEEYLGTAGAQVVVQIGDQARRDASGLLVMTLGILALVLGAARAFGELQGALNLVWNVPSRPSIKGALYQRLIGFLMVLGLGLLLLASVVASAALNLATSVLGRFAGGDTVLRMADFLLSFGVVLLALLLIYKYVPDARIEWRDVWIGAVITALLFTLGKTLIGAYLGTSAVQSPYGAAASLVAVLLWFYYSAMVFFYGAEWTQVYACEYGSKIRGRRASRADESICP